MTHLKNISNKVKGITRKRNVKRRMQRKHFKSRNCSVGILNSWGVVQQRKRGAIPSRGKKFFSTPEKLHSVAQPVYLSMCTVQLKCDGTRWRMGGEVKGKLANGVGIQYPSHYLGTWCMHHYYRWRAHLGCQ